MTVIPATASSPRSTTAASDPRPSDAPAGTASDYQTFLRMLTAQIRNQDPLNPIQSSDYAVQLATFSGVEQQVKTNDLLTRLAAQLGLSGIANLADWVGRDVKVPGAASFDGSTPLALSIAPEPRADQAVLVTLDMTGNEILRQPVPVAGGDLSWAGGDGKGGKLAPGTYSFRLESFRAGTKVGEGSDVPSWRRVTEVRTGTSGAEIVFPDGSSALAATVAGLRNPAAPTG